MHYNEEIVALPMPEGLVPLPPCEACGQDLCNHERVAPASGAATRSYGVIELSNVVDLSERRALRDASEPCAATIAEIEHLLARAKRGEVVGVAYACATSSGSMGTGFEFGRARSGFALLAGAHVLARRLEDEHR